MQEDVPKPQTPLRWFSFCISSWETDKEHFLLLWLAWFIPLLDVM